MPRTAMYTRGPPRSRSSTSWPDNRKVRMLLVRPRIAGISIPNSVERETERKRC